MQALDLASRSCGGRLPAHAQPALRSEQIINACPVKDTLCPDCATSRGLPNTQQGVSESDSSCSAVRGRGMACNLTSHAHVVTGPRGQPRGSRPSLRVCMRAALACTRSMAVRGRHIGCRAHCKLAQLALQKTLDKHLALLPQVQLPPQPLQFLIGAQHLRDCSTSQPRPVRMRNSVTTAAGRAVMSVTVSSSLVTIFTWPVRGVR